MTQVPETDGNEFNTQRWIEYCLAGNVRDSIVPSIATITTPHKEIHEGEHFRWLNYQTSLNGSLLYLFVAGPTELPHFTHALGGNGAARVTLYEDCDPDDDGTLDAGWNSKRNDAGTPTMAVYVNPSVPVGSEGTIRDVIFVGGTNVGQTSVAGEGGRDDELILEAASKWLAVVATPEDIAIGYKASWYEEADPA